ncbi:GMC oxidoreductase [Streptomyces sp. NPDC006516]|uniref:GMC oxidoreductase n=1 Tax=Streptomyces sp. NPDC006516 TaxID=3154309 RepID=UPI0033A3F4F6
MACDGRRKRFRGHRPARPDPPARHGQPPRRDGPPPAQGAAHAGRRHLAPLGGAPTDTACDLEGRARGQRGLYVLHRALIPGTSGACNPSSTIGAFAEEALDVITAHDIDTII